jgi:hypothetical protein
MDKQTRLRLDYAKPIAQQLHDELFKTTSEFKYYELGVTTGIYSIYNALDYLMKNKHETINIKQLMDVVVQSVDGSNMKNMLNRMIDYDKESEDENKQ